MWFNFIAALDHRVWYIRSSILEWLSWVSGFWKCIPSVKKECAILIECFGGSCWSYYSLLFQESLGAEIGICFLSLVSERRSCVYKYGVAYGSFDQNIACRGTIWHTFDKFMSIWSAVMVFCDENVNSWRCLPCFFLRVAGMVVVIIGGFRVCICF